MYCQEKNSPSFKSYEGRSRESRKLDQYKNQSYSGSPLSSYEKDLITRLEDKILLNKVDIGLATQKSTCSSLFEIIEDHNCEICVMHSEKSSTSKSLHFSDEDTRELDPTHGFID
ncbi:hypothetical protein R6Q59_006525 [Mikania micrantha]